jgi:hypothetical protein
MSRKCVFRTASLLALFICCPHDLNTPSIDWYIQGIPILFEHPGIPDDVIFSSDPACKDFISGQLSDRKVRGQKWIPIPMIGGRDSFFYACYENSENTLLRRLITVERSGYGTEAIDRSSK